jgi:hypothetical protein
MSRIRFGGFPLGVQIMVRESSRLACMAGPAREPVVLIGSGAVVFAKADDGSHLVLDCPVLLEGDSSQSYSHFVQCLELSVCKMSGFSWSGPNIIGKQFYCDNSDFSQPSGTAPSGYTVGIPGTGHDNPDSRCKVR